jgi:hypothetical protein
MNNKSYINNKNKDALHDLVLKEFKIAIYNGDIEQAIGLDIFHYNELVKKSEEVVYWDRWQKDTLDIRHSLTCQFNNELPLARPVAKGPYSSLIVHHNYSGLAHESQLARNLSWLRSNGVNFNIEIAYLFGSDISREKASNLYNIPLTSIHYIDATCYIHAGKKLNELTKNLRCQGIIYPSIFYMAYWMSLLVPHNNQKFIQMKYYPLHSGRIRDWFGGYRGPGRYYQIKNCKFEQLPILDLRLHNTLISQLQRDPEPLTFGSISRPEKISSPGYNQFIFDLLDSHISLNYLYTGRQESLHLIPENIRLHPQSKALGWVEPSISISNFSIYLEPFPWGGGEMTLLALESGLPYLTLETKENIEFGIYGFIKSIAVGNDPILQFSFCNSMSILRERIGILISNSSMRNQLGRAWRQALLSYKPPDIDGWIRLLTK